MNPLLSLGPVLRTLFRSMLQMSADLDVDADRRAKWGHICEHLSNFPLQARNGKTVFRYSEKGMAMVRRQYAWASITSSPPAQSAWTATRSSWKSAATRSRKWRRWHDGNGFSSWYTACARVGYDPQTILD